MKELNFATPEEVGKMIKENKSLKQWNTKYKKENAKLKELLETNGLAVKSYKTENAKLKEEIESLNNMLFHDGSHSLRH